MPIEVQEQEMILRFSDSLSKAASISKQFMTAKEVEKPKLFTDFIHELKCAAGSFHQLGIYQENTNFLTLRDKIEAVIEYSQVLPTFTGQQAGLWFQIRNSLLAMSEYGCTMATSKAMKRVDVLANLSFREAQERQKNDNV